MANAFTDAKTRQAGRKTKLDELTDHSLKEMMRVYDKTNDSIYAELVRMRRKKGYLRGPQNDFLRWLSGELKDFGRRFGDKMLSALTRTTKVSVRAAHSEIGAYGKSNSSLTKKLENNERFVKDSFEDQFLYVAAQTNRMKAQVVQMLREESAMVARLAAVEGISKKAAADMLMKRMLEREPSFEFVDKSNRRWDSRVYFEMLAKTVIANLEREAYVNTLIEEGHDLVRISSHGSKDPCKGWEGKILSLTGKTKGYLTLGEAVASGQIFHPRCRHRLYAHYESEK